jgi:hypothetical protein
MPSVEDRDDNDRVLPKTQTDMAQLPGLNEWARLVELERRVKALERRGVKGQILGEAYGMSPTGRLVDDSPEIPLPGVDGVPSEDEIREDFLRKRIGNRQVERENWSMSIARTTLVLAERRIREYMTGHFSEATIGGVVNALHGSTPDKPQPFDKSRCPTCDSPDPRMHPSVSGGGEVTARCSDSFHGESKG